ncbi:hypothetical protein PIB30_043909 [Stylosanthes scabra]|uniref:Uncharacterized protein n=1 Tax=Stylosanthes scabra TaxID=79078 RepID=A0ABU6UF08_9FABA|nr:hypothetical protein [Stylosanthes scabra]
MDAIHRPAEKSRMHNKGPTKISVVKDGEEVEPLNHPRFSRSSMTVPIGVPYCSASAGGTPKAVPVSSIGGFVSCCDSGRLHDTDTLRRGMKEIATIQGLAGPIEPEPENRPPCSVSLHDFKVAMQLNPGQLGEDWPLSLDKISMLSFHEFHSGCSLLPSRHRMPQHVPSHVPCTRAVPWCELMVGRVDLSPNCNYRCAPARFSPRDRTGPKTKQNGPPNKMDKKGKKIIRYPQSKIYAKATAAKCPIAPTPPLASPSALPKPTKKEPVIIDLTKDNDSEEKARQTSQERKLTNTFHRMLGIGKAGSHDSYLGTPSTTSGSSDDDDFLRDESMY